MQPDSANETIGKNVAHLRAMRSMKQTELADALARRTGKAHMDPTTITRLEQGKRPVTVVELLALADIFDVSHDSLLTTPTKYSEQAQEIVKSLNDAPAIRERAIEALASWIEEHQYLSTVRRRRPEYVELLSESDQRRLRHVTSDSLKALADEAAGRHSSQTEYRDEDWSFADTDT